MSNRHKIIYLRNRIMIDIEKVILLLDVIASDRIETIKEASILARTAWEKCRQINKNNQKIGKILGC
ncbi:MAG: hypothetical protein PHC64_04335 [Candidatus Gastranaerophilales bacterium]|nr:hypothetical protein [Candidatus Gastranaerophilales bacterium]